MTVGFHGGLTQTVVTVVQQHHVRMINVLALNAPDVFLWSFWCAVLCIYKGLKTAHIGIGAGHWSQTEVISFPHLMVHFEARKHSL